MDPFSAVLLGMQAGGMVFNYISNQGLIKDSQAAEQATQDAINQNIKQLRLQSEDSTLQSMVQLRKTLGSQAAILAARGTGGGSSLGILAAQESESNFNADTKIRKQNLAANIAALNANQQISRLHEETFENDLNNQLTKDVVNKIPTSRTAWGGDSGSTNNFGLTKVRQ